MKLEMIVLGCMFTFAILLMAVTYFFITPNPWGFDAALYSLGGVLLGFSFVQFFLTYREYRR